MKCGDDHEDSLKAVMQYKSLHEFSPTNKGGFAIWLGISCLFEGVFIKIAFYTINFMIYVENSKFFLYNKFNVFAVFLCAKSSMSVVF